MLISAVVGVSAFQSLLAGGVSRVKAESLGRTLAKQTKADGNASVASSLARQEGFGMELCWRGVGRMPLGNVDTRAQ